MEAAIESLQECNDGERFSQAASFGQNKNLVFPSFLLANASASGLILTYEFLVLSCLKHTSGGVRV